MKLVNNALISRSIMVFGRPEGRTLPVQVLIIKLLFGRFRITPLDEEANRHVPGEQA